MSGLCCCYRGHWMLPGAPDRRRWITSTNWKSGCGRRVKHSSRQRWRVTRKAGVRRGTRHTLGDDFLNRLAEIQFQPLATGHFEFARVEAQLMQDRGMDVRNVMPILDGMKT